MHGKAWVDITFDEYYNISNILYTKLWKDL